jgi:serine/threonine-protein kinase
VLPKGDGDGEVLDGHWRLERKLGRGGMGIVYLAHDLELDRPVAIKMLAPQYCDDPGLVQRFEREARMMAKLDHPNLVPVFSVGRTAQGPYIVMKLLEGMTLGEMLKARGRLSLPEALMATRQLAAGLQFIHDRQVVHRDVKPANIFVGPDGHVTLLDLGVARDSTSDLTRTGVLLGTPRYMSPEQIHGEPADHRSDLYALATVVFEMVTGQPVFEANSDFSLMRAHIEKPPPDPSKFVEVSPELTAALLKALSKDPAARFQSARELADALEMASGPAAPSASRPGAGLVPRLGPGTGLHPLTVTIPQARATPKPVSGAGMAPPDATQYGGEPEPSMQSDARAAPQGIGDRSLWAALGALALVAGGGVTYLLRGGGDGNGTTEPNEGTELVAEVPDALVAQGRVPWDAGGSSDAGPSEDEGTKRPIEGGIAERAAGTLSPPPSARGPRRKKEEAAEVAEVICHVTVKRANSWAYVEVDGMRQGATPLVLKLEPGRHQLVFMRPGFRRQVRDLILAPGENLKMLVEMAP